MTPRLEILPSQQRRLWKDLSQIPAGFILYGGTGIALRLGHRQSVDFDFFSGAPLSAETLVRTIPFLVGAQLLQAEPNTATFSVHRDGAIKVSFFGGLSFGRVGAPDLCEDNGIYVASLLDLAAQKMKVILSRAEAKDYLDIYALLKSGIALPEALGATKALFPEFNPVPSLKAIAYHGEPELAAMPAEIRQFLTVESAKVEYITSVKIQAVRIDSLM